ncbi:MAG: ABC transporter permease [Actinomycetota bacterium]
MTGRPATRVVEALSRDVSTLVWLGILALIFLASAFFGFPAPLGVTFQGAVTGSVISFISIGLVLIYRTSRIINFAGAQIGTTAMLVGVLLVAQSGWNWFAGVGIGIAIAVAAGALIELAVVRRFFKSPRLILTVATVALALILGFISLILPGLWDLDIAAPRMPPPVDFTFSIPDPRGETFPVRFDANHLIALISVPIVIGGLGAFLKFTRAGVASRAVADNADRASLLGVPVKRVSTVVWTVAAGLSGLGALMRASTVGLPLLGQALDSGLLVRALAPAVAGRMESLATTFVASVVLGIVDQTVFFRASDPAISNMILFVVILAALVLRRRGQISRAGETEGATWQAAKEVRPIPRELQAVPEVRYGKPIAGGALILAMILFGALAPESRVNILSLVLIFGILGASLVILTGWAGQISLGQVAFFAIGAAICGKLAMENDFNLLLVIPLAGLAGAVVAMVIGLPALRIRGLFLAASTAAFALFVGSMVLNPNYFGWFVPGRGRLDRPQLFGIDLASHRTFYFFVLVALLLILASIRSLRRSRTGRVLIGGRDNERAARSFAVNVTFSRLTAFALSGFYAAIAGALYAIHQNTVNATAFGVERSLQVFVMVVLGGIGSVPGALIGAAYFFGAQYFVSPTLSLLLTGGGMLIVLMILPGGLGQLMYGWRDNLLRWIAKRRNIVVPSLVADVRVDEAVLLPGAKADAEAASPAPVPVSGGSE